MKKESSNEKECVHIVVGLRCMFSNGSTVAGTNYRETPSGPTQPVSKPYFIKRSKPCDRSRPEAGATHPAFFCHFGRTGLVAIRKCPIVAEPCAVAV
jgi:hypothetical protein